MALPPHSAVALAADAVATPPVRQWAVALAADAAVTPPVRRLELALAADVAALPLLLAVVLAADSAVTPPVRRWGQCHWQRTWLRCRGCRPRTLLHCCCGRCGAAVAAPPRWQHGGADSADGDTPNDDDLPIQAVGRRHCGCQWTKRVGVVRDVKL